MRRRQIEVWKSPADGEWYWRLRGRNGRVLAVGGEGFQRRGGAIKGARSACGSLLSVIDVDPPTEPKRHVSIPVTSGEQWARVQALRAEARAKTERLKREEGRG
jgi:uncharacterized protein YegP (UPF0339 family)